MRLYSQDKQQFQLLCPKKSHIYVQVTKTSRDRSSYDLPRNTEGSTVMLLHSNKVLILTHAMIFPKPKHVVFVPNPNQTLTIVLSHH